MMFLIIVIPKKEKSAPAQGGGESAKGISFHFLSRIEPYQEVMATPWEKSLSHSRKMTSKACDRRYGLKAIGGDGLRFPQDSTTFYFPEAIVIDGD